MLRCDTICLTSAMEWGPDGGFRLHPAFNAHTAQRSSPLDAYSIY
jgi:hypothetical protein